MEALASSFALLLQHWLLSGLHRSVSADCIRAAADGCTMKLGLRESRPGVLFGCSELSCNGVLFDSFSGARGAARKEVTEVAEPSGRL